MRASILVEPKKSKIQEMATPIPEANEVLIRVETCGVCASDLHRWKGEGKFDYPTRLGHEPSGVIEGIGDSVRGFEIGQRVAALAPGRGAFSEFITVPQESVIPIPGNIGFTEAIVEPIGCLISGIERTEIKLADRVAIIGCGFMGLSLLQLVTNRGAREIVAVDVREDAIENALRLGADRATLPENITHKDKVVTWDQIGQGFDVVFETSGKQPALTLAG